MPAATPPPLKTSYAIGEVCWVHIGAHDAAGNPTKTQGKVVYWMDLPDLAQRYYIVRLLGSDWMHLVVRDFTIMSATADEAFPFQKSRHDDERNPEGSDRVRDWRNS